MAQFPNVPPVAISPGLPKKPSLEEFLAEWAGENLSMSAAKDANADHRLKPFPFCREQMGALAAALKEKGYAK